MSTGVFSTEQAVAYWEQRHRTYDALRSGGDVGMSATDNAAFYAVRTARLIKALGDAAATGAGTLAPPVVLDAGCGKGHFARALASLGHRVVGIDTSASAIEQCRSQGGSNEDYHVAALVDWRSAQLYDAVISIDVLFHVMDDVEWLAAVRNLCSLVRLGGRIVLVDHDRDEDHLWSNYQKTRARPRYRSVLESEGFRVEGFIPNDFRRDPSGFHVATRVA